MIRSDLALAALATAAVPGMRPVQVAAVRTGEESPLHQSALVEDVTGRTWLVRAPLSAAAGAELERNDDLIRHLGRHLPFKVPAAAGYADLGEDGRAAVYPYVEGLALNLRHLPVGPGLTHAVGRALAAIHNMPRELFEEFAVPLFDAAEYRNRKLAELDRAAETGQVPNGLLARWEEALDAEAMWQFTTVPTHGSLDGSSFLVSFSDEEDSASGRVVGITGWERAQVADPAEDFARLVQQAHPHAVDAVFESYAMARSQRPDGYLLHRAKLASEMRLLNGLVAAMGSDDQGFVRTRADQLRKLDRLTANDSSLVPRTAGAEPSVDEPGTGHAPAVDPAQDLGAAPARVDEDGTQARAEHTADDTVAESVAQSRPEESAVTGDEADEPAVIVDGADEPAVIVERPAEEVHPEPAEPEETAKASPADVTAPIPMFQPVKAAGATDAPEQPAPDSPDEDTGTTDEDAERERLHTLYGMPEDDEPDPPAER